MTTNEAARARAHELLGSARHCTMNATRTAAVHMHECDAITALLVSHDAELATARAALLDLSSRVASVETERDEARDLLARAERFLAPPVTFGLCTEVRDFLAGGARTTRTATKDQP